MRSPTRRLSLVFTVATWIFLAGCAGSAPPQAAADEGRRQPPPPGPPLGDSSGLVLTQMARPTTLAPGDTLHVTLMIRNPTVRDISRRFTSGCTAGFALWGDDGIAVPPPPVCTMNVPVIVYAAESTETRTWTWVWDGAAPAPGTYRLHAGLGVRGAAAAAAGVDVRLQR